jgi:UDP-N-acetylmuramoylalanine--D-glutamate ligase
VKKVYAIGRAAEDMAGAWGAVVPCEVCGDLERAVRAAAEEAEPGETVLLSPGCASFDQFRDYEDRGERFAESVAEIAG